MALAVAVAVGVVVAVAAAARAFDRMRAAVAVIPHGGASSWVSAGAGAAAVVASWVDSLCGGCVGVSTDVRRARLEREGQAGGGGACIVGCCCVAVVLCAIPGPGGAVTVQRGCRPMPCCDCPPAFTLLDSKENEMRVGPQLRRSMLAVIWIDAWLGGSETRGRLLLVCSRFSRRRRVCVTCYHLKTSSRL
jgi:hypothetical protein